MVISATLICFGQKNSKTYPETRKLLAELEEYSSTGSLAKLFQIGDEGIDDLIFALDDEDENVRLNSQRLIRYLGNAKGTNALYIWLDDWLKNPQKKQFIAASGAIPLPINQWEFDFAERKIKQSGDVLESGLGMDNIYPLLLDDSTQARELLEKIVAEMGKGEYGKYWVDRTNLIIKNNPKKVFKENGDLAKSVLENAYFLHPNDAQKTSVKLLAYNGKKSKALLFLGNFGATWHVVLEKDGEGWKFFSITQTSVS